MSELTITPLPQPGMLSIRADLSRYSKTISDALGLSVPEPLRATQDNASTLLWFSPDELLLICAPLDLAQRQAALAVELDGAHHLLVDVSDMRAGFELHGPGLREVLAKLVPIDLHPDVFRPGHVRRTHLAQVAVALWMVEEDKAHVLCFRSVAGYVAECLSASANSAAAVDLEGK
ncbi:MAG: sarcosine oxidase subunit gamma family protein [Dinoroseobacter sp.]|nr:sarcosine oxidase subunit gamma family protein [Dinoroseobacter sp.]